MQSPKKRPGIFFSCYSQKSREGEQFIAEHTLGYLISGNSEIFVGGEKYELKSGDFSFFRRNQLIRFTKFPSADGQEYKSISVTLDQEILKKISKFHNWQAERSEKEINGLRLPLNSLLSNYKDSLTPYLNDNNQISGQLINLKVKEAIMILLETDPRMKNVLFDFQEPGKIDLEAYMNANYRFNVGMNRFAYLTGRSMATFKRDFTKIFNTSPSRWIQQKRLTDAHYLIREKGWKSSEVYMEVGFKDFSHFSYAFKKTYGISPSMVSPLAV